MRDNRRFQSRLSMCQARRVFGITARAIRHYEEFGLLEPTRDSLNRRQFEGETLRRLDWIVALRAVGIPIRAIQAVLDADPASGEVATVALSRLEDRRRVLVDQLKVIEQHSQALRAEGCLARLDQDALLSAA